MTTRIDLTTTVLDAAPGDVVTAQLVVHNEDATDATYRVHVVGLDSIEQTAPIHEVRVPAGTSASCDVPVAVPMSLGIGDHAAAFEITSDRPTDRPVLSPFTISIASVERVALLAIPSTIRARRRAKFKVELANNEPEPVTVSLEGSAPDVDVRFDPDQFHLLPGQLVTTRGKVRGPRHWVGETTQHNLLLTARGRASSSSITTPFVQRPVFARRLRMVVAALTVVALWLAAIGGVALWLSNRNDDAPVAANQIVAVDTDGDGIPDAFFAPDGTPITGIDTDGDGIPDTFTDADGNPITGTDTDGDGIPDTFVDANGNPITGIDTDGDGIPDTFVDANGNPIGDGSDADSDDDQAAADVPTHTVVRGTIDADGDVSDVSVQMAPIALGAAPSPQSAALGFAGAGNASPSKIWSARFGRVDSTLNPIRQTEPVAPLETTPEADGIWLFSDVALRQSYEIVFAKPGYDTQSFVITPPEDGSAVELDVSLESAKGSISGRVTGPSGPLGGAEIEITDGTLSFTTTSATDGDIGSWSIEGVSTPGIYTVAAKLRGYGTEVLQVNLDAGEERTGADLAMRRGVGAIGGRIVGERGEPLGGVTVTATNGEVSRTTTSLTDGNIGAYNIPQLDIPGVYTVTVELDGYITQSRRVALGGSIDGIDFALVDSSLRLTGRIMSSEGGGIPNAGVTLSTGDLKFRVATAAAPDAGAFAIDQLPPGLYSITVDHYEHLSATEFITLEAGVPPPPLNVTLEATEGPPPIEGGSLVVEVIDPTAIAGGTGVREISGATVTIYKKSAPTKIVRQIKDQESYNFAFPDMPIGTYLVRVTAPRYNPAPDQTVTIGQAERTIRVEMQRLGQASGDLIDPTDPSKVFVGYRVSLYRTPLGSPYEPREPGDTPFLTVAAGSDGRWKTLPDQLVTGTYEVVVDQQAAELDGYIIRPDQILDPEVTGPTPASRQMRFLLSADNVDPIEVGDIEADPYPNISGIVYKPELSGGATSLVPIDNSSLGVTITCPRGSLDLRDPATSDATGITDDLTSPGNESFNIDKIDVKRSNLTGNCQLRYSATGYSPTTLPLNGVRPANGPTVTDRTINAALVAPAPSIGGRLYWTDPGLPTASRQLPVAGANVSVANPIVGFGEPTPAVPVPAIRLSDSTTTAGNGTWNLTGQVFGTSQYNFSKSGFDTGSISVTIDQTGIKAPTPVNGTVTGVAVEAGGKIAVELRQPDDGSITGQIDLLSNRTQNAGDYTAVTITATDPTGTDRSGAVTRQANGAFTISPARAGTWTLEFSEPDNYDFLASASDDVLSQVGPGQTGVAADTTLVELATLELTLEKTGGAAITDDPTISLTPTGANGTPIVDEELTANASGVSTRDNITVHPSDPLGLAVPYDLDVTVSGYDTSAVQDIPLDVEAGDVVERTFVLPEHGTIAGDVTGNLDGASAVRDLDIEAPGRFVVTPPGGVGPTDFTLSRTANSYVLSGPAGVYSITVSSPGFVGETQNVTIQNDVDAVVDFELDIVKGNLDLTAVRSLAAPTPVPVVGAEYFLFPDAPDCTTYDVDTDTPTATGAITAATGRIVVEGLFPGDYCLQLRERTETPAGSDIYIDDAFPAITTVRIAESGNTTPTTATVVAPLPEIQASVTATVKAENANGDPLPLPAVELSVTLDFGVNLIQVGDDPSSTVANQNSGSETVKVTPNGTATSASFLFSRVPTGVHELTVVSPPAGYTAINSPLTVTVTDGGTAFGPSTPGDSAELILQVSSVNVVATLTSDGSTTSSAAEKFYFSEVGAVVLTAPSAATYPGTFDDAAKTITFANVAPEDGNFQLTIGDPLHTYPAKAAGTIPVAVTGFSNAFKITATPSAGRVTGTMRQQNTAGNYSNLGATDAAGNPAATVGLTGPSSYDESITADGTAETFTFDVPAGSYELTAERIGYTSFSQTVIATNGMEISPSPALTINRKAPLQVTITNTTLPGGTKVELVDNDADSTRTPFTAAGSVFTLDADPGTYNYVEVTAPGHRTIRDPQNPVLTLAIGVPRTREFALVPRTVSVNVTDGSNNPITDASVAVAIGSTTSTKTASPYTFSSLDATNPLPTTGSGTVTVSKDGKRTVRQTLNGSASQTKDIQLRDDVTVTGSVTATGTPITSLGATVGDQVVWAESGTDKVYGTITVTDNADPTPDTAAYSIGGLSNNDDGTARTWTIKYDKIRVGTATSSTVSVNATATTAPAGPALTITPQPIAVTFTVTDGSNGLGGATVSIPGNTPATASTRTTDDPGTPENEIGTVTVNVLEHLTNWTASKTPRYVTSSNQALPTFTSRAATSDSVALVDRQLAVTAKKGANGVNNFDIWICAVPSTPGPCATTGSNSGSTNDGTLEFLPPATTGSYQITAVGAGSKGTVNLAVGGSNSLGTTGTLGNTEITLT